MTDVMSQGTELYDDDGEFIGYACIDCSRAVHDWGADDGLWESIMGNWDAGHICSDCFMRRASAMGIQVHVTRWECCCE